MSTRFCASRATINDLDFGSRNSYRNRIEKLARYAKRTEIEVASAAIALAQEAAQAPEPDPHKANVGAFLTGMYREELEKRVGYTPTLAQQALRVIQKMNWFAVAAPVLFLTFLALASSASS